MRAMLCPYECLSFARFFTSILGASDVNALSTLTGSVDEDELHLDQPQSYHYTIDRDETVPERQY